MPSLSGSQFSDFHQALLDAFDREGLRRLVKFELDENLDAITGGGSLSQTAFDLIEWSERRGRRDELLAGALAQNPQNSALQKLARQLGVALPSDAAAGEQAPASKPDSPPTVNTGGGVYVAGDINIQGGDFVGRDKIVKDETGQSQPPWWDQLSERIEELAAANPSSGDTINVNIGDNAKNIAIGKNLQQTITEVIGEPTPDDKTVIEESLVTLVEQLSTAQQQQAAFQLQMLETELTKTGEDEQPSGSAITLAGDWMLDNLPDIGEALASFFALPAVGRVLGKAGKDTINWAKDRFG